MQSDYIGCFCQAVDARLKFGRPSQGAHDYPFCALLFMRLVYLTAFVSTEWYDTDPRNVVTSRFVQRNAPILSI